jgi:hypothetical protein
MRVLAAAQPTTPPSPLNHYTATTNALISRVLTAHRYAHLLSVSILPPYMCMYRAYFDDLGNLYPPPSLSRADIGSTP